MANNPKQQLLEWLALKPRTQGWGAVVAYDRDKCNNLLLQDYINKFTTGDYLDPINKPVGTGNANWEHLNDWITDRPRLSFEKGSASGKADLRMAVLGGTQVSIDDVWGHKRAIAVKSIDALDHPELIAENVSLSKTSGTVGKDIGEVVLDLGDPENTHVDNRWELTFATTQHERRIGGAFFKQYYKEADPLKRLYHLGKVAYTEQQYLKPKSFRLRIMTAKGAESSASANYGDGTVELFICMEGELEGGTPPVDDWKSPIPDDVPGEYDSAIIVSNKIVMNSVLVEGVRRMVGQGDIFEAPPASGFIRKLRSIDSRAINDFVGPPPAYQGRGFRVTFGAFVTAPHADMSLNIMQSDIPSDQVRVDWSRNNGEKYEVRATSEYGGDNSYIPMNMSLTMSAHGKFEVNAESGTVRMIATPPTSSAFSIDPWHAYHDVVNQERDAINAHILSHYERSCVELFGFYFTVVDEIDTFVLNSLLFEDETHKQVKLKSVSMPGDLITFGIISSPFVVEPLEHLMGHSATHQFKVAQALTGKVVWSVTAIPGSTGEVGTIDRDTGLYTAPALADIPGTFIRVRITAEDLHSKYSSSAMVTVVVRDITVNPVVQTCGASTADTLFTRTLSANTLGEGILEWKVKRGTGTIPPRAGADRENTFTAGLKNPDLEGTFTIDEIEVKNIATDKTQSSFVVVTHFSAELTVTIDLAQSDFPNGKAKLIAKDNRDRIVTAIWKVAEGNGSIDSNGVYTGNPDGQQRFAIVTAHTMDGEFIGKDGWIILPFPLFELPDKPPKNLMVD